MQANCPSLILNVLIFIDMRTVRKQKVYKVLWQVYFVVKHWLVSSIAFGKMPTIQEKTLCVCVT
jgi:hypothetical protein